MSTQNTINVSFDLRPATLSYLEDLLRDDLVDVSKACPGPATTELWNMLNEIRSTLQHYVASKTAPPVDWL